MKVWYRRKRVINLALTLIVVVATAWASAGKTNAPTAPATTSNVVSVVDGDTIKVAIQGITTTVRLIGIDTPETVDPRKTVQCFGTQASDHAKTVLTGQTVRLEADASQGDKDKYGRLLRYVYLPDGTLFNKSQIADGYAHEYTYNVPYRFQAEFKAAEASARETGRGLWAPSTCGGNTTQPPPAG